MAVELRRCGLVRRGGLVGVHPARRLAEVDQDPWFTLTSWSIRTSMPSKEHIAKISIDWIMRGAMRRRMSVRICCEVSRRMVLNSAARDGNTRRYELNVGAVVG
jgi:hypothetical protein